MMPQERHDLLRSSVEVISISHGVSTNKGIENWLCGCLEASSSAQGGDVLSEGLCEIANFSRPELHDARDLLSYHGRAYRNRALILGGLQKLY